MANTRSAEKQERQAVKRNARNRGGRTRLRSALRKARTGIVGGDADKDVISTGFSEIDKAAKRGLIKGNTANRYKARLSAASKRVATATK